MNINKINTDKIKQQAYAVHNGPWLSPSDFSALFADIDDLKTAITKRNLIEGKAHALFTESFSDGSRIAHTPDTCNPLGFVKLLRERVEKELALNKSLRKENESLVDKIVDTEH